MVKVSCGRAVAWLLAFMLGGCGGGGGGSAGPGSGGGGDYLPSSANSSWHYTESIVRMAVRSTGPAVVAGLSGDLLRTEDADGALLNETLIVHQSGETWAVPVSGHDPITMAIGAVKLFGDTTPGARFVQADRSVDVDLDYDGVAERIAVRSDVSVIDNAPLSTPAGSFAATLHLRTVMTMEFVYTGGGGAGRIATTENAWYVAGVGLVRRDVDVPGFSTLQRLLTRYVVDGRRNEAIAPGIVSVSPEGLQPTRFPTVVVQFSEPMEASSVCAALSVTDAQGRAVAGRCRSMGDRLEFELLSPVSGTFDARIAPAATDLVGNALQAERRWSFALDVTGPTLLSSNVAEGATDVPLDTFFMLRFSKTIEPASFSFSTFTLSAEFAPPVAIEVVLAGDTITVRPRQPLARGTRYTLIVPATLSDMVGNALGQPYVISFVTDQGRFGMPQELLPQVPLLSIVASVAADVNNDGRSDVLFFTGAGSPPFERSLVVRLQGTDGSLSAPVPYARALDDCSSLDWMEVADFDGDGRIDVALGGSSCAARWMRQLASGEFVAAGNITTFGARSGRVVDLDRDGQPELLVNLVQRIEVWRMRAGVWELAIPAMTAPVGSWDDIAGGDLTGDGRPDIILLGSSTTGLSLLVLPQTPSGTFDTPRSVAFPNSYGLNKLDLLDMNGDGLLDVAASSSFFTDTRLVLQQPDGSLSSPVALAVGSSSNGLLAVDVDGDARVDLVSATYGLAGVHLRRSDGSLAPERVYGFGSDTGPWMRPAAADFNGDGRIDLLVGDAILYQKISMLPDSARARALAGVMLNALPRR